MPEKGSNLQDDDFSITFATQKAPLAQPMIPGSTGKSKLQGVIYMGFDHFMLPDLRRARADQLLFTSTPSETLMPACPIQRLIRRTWTD